MGLNRMNLITNLKTFPHTSRSQSMKTIRTIRMGSQAVPPFVPEINLLPNRTNRSNQQVMSNNLRLSINHSL